MQLVRHGSGGGGGGFGGPPIGSPNLSPGARKLLIACAVSTLGIQALNFLAPAVAGTLHYWLASPSLWRPWTLIGATLVHLGVLPFFITAVMLLWFAPAVERRYGERGLIGSFLTLSAIGYLGAMVALTSRGLPTELAATAGSTFAFTGLLAMIAAQNKAMDIYFMFLVKLNLWKLTLFLMAVDLFYLIGGGGQAILASGSLIAALAGIGWANRTLSFLDPLMLGRPETLVARARTALGAAGKGASRKDASHLSLVRGGKDPWRRDEDDQGPVVH